MLKHLSIQNYVLIEKLDLDFSNGLSIITGETGAGKSILIGALSLILGDRADSKVLRNADKKCIVEGTFDVSQAGIKDLFREYDLDYDSNTIFRREINPAGKSRAFINDTPVKLAQLKGFATKLVDIHSQHEKLLLYNPGFHLSVIDAFACNDELLNAYKYEYKQYKIAEVILEGLLQKEKSAIADLDYLKFQLNELQELSMIPDEYEELEEEAKSLSHVEEIKSGLQESINTLNSENGVGDILSKAMSSLLSLKSYINEISNLYDRLNSVHIETNDIIEEIENIQDSTEYNPDRLLFVNERLDKINNLLHKHSLSNISQLIDLQHTLEKSLDKTSSLGEEIIEKQQQLEEFKINLTISAEKLSRGRKDVFLEIEDSINVLLRKMSMNDAQLSVRHKILNDFGADGIDDIELFLKANRGGVFTELGKAASGGELSRVMFAIKSAISKLTKLPTMIFDEIDSGISGEVADKMGVLMHEMADSLQVITITHLPQIASKANAHYLAFKESDSKTTRTSIKQLSNDERLDEIAKMLSGEELSNAALENAKELLKNSKK